MKAQTKSIAKDVLSYQIDTHAHTLQIIYHNVPYYLLLNFALLCNNSQNTPLEQLSLLSLQSITQQFSFQKSLKHQQSMNLRQHHIKNDHIFLWY
jgi:hypothetical protein